MIATLLMPGINNSGPAHWQSLWEQTYPGFARIQVPDWDRPVCAEWVDAVAQAVRAMCDAGTPPRIVAHSLGCLAVLEWALQAEPGQAAGLMLVAVPDALGAQFPAEAVGFRRPPRHSLPFPSLVVASEDDPYGSRDFAEEHARGWGSRFVSIGAAGHVNASSGLGAWPQGMRLLDDLCGSAVAG